VPITVEDYLNSRMIADPIRLLDCVMLADGAAGLIVTSRKRAKEKGLNKCVIPIGYAERTNFLGGENLVDVTRSGHEIAGKKALAAAGWNIKNVRSFHPYDDFLIALVIQLEAFGFCKRGEAKDFITDGNIDLDGTLPVNTNGGLLGEAYIHGLNNIVEGVRQVRGSAANQIAEVEHVLVAAGQSGLVLGRA
jgi:acetyl-CoA acetyltransferase